MNKYNSRSNLNPNQPPTTFVHSFNLQPETTTQLNNIKYVQYAAPCGIHLCASIVDCCCWGFCCAVAVMACVLCVRAWLREWLTLICDSFVYRVMIWLTTYDSYWNRLECVVLHVLGVWLVEYTGVCVCEGVCVTVVCVWMCGCVYLVYGCLYLCEWVCFTAGRRWTKGRWRFGLMLIYSVILIYIQC